MDGETYSPDGSPVALYARLPGTQEASIIDRELPPHATILELGCGTGRLTHELIARGHHVTAVDNSAAMLARVRGAETILADIVGLDLGRRFAAVVLWSNFVNTADDDERNELVATCRRHVARDGIVLVWRHQPGWVQTAIPARSEGPDENGIVWELSSVVHDGDRLSAVAAWEIDGVRYEQPFDAVDIDDDAMAALARAHSLELVAVGGPQDMLVRLRPAR